MLKQILPEAENQERQQRVPDTGKSMKGALHDQSGPMRMWCQQLHQGERMGNARMIGVHRLPLR